MPLCRLDHLVITAPSLAAGAAFVREVLGVTPQSGGAHPAMGTHNLLLRLGENLYLEVIAVDPQAPAPNRPRWFGLDRLAATPPRLAAWVVRTGNIQAATAAGSEPLGAIEEMRRGDLRWQITIPADGRVPLDGVGPALIEWQSAPHPAAGLRDEELTLAALELHHPDPSRVARLLTSLDVASPPKVFSSSGGEAPRLVARIRTPRSLRELSAS